MIGRSRSRVCLLGVVAVVGVTGVGAVAMAGGGAASSRRAPVDLLAARPILEGVDIQQSYDLAGDPALIANANVAGDRARPQWSVCPPPNVEVCEPVTGIAPKAGPTSEFLNPGDTAAGTVFRATLTTKGHTYSARTGIWLGRVRAISSPTLSGRPRFDTSVTPAGATWAGGWSEPPTASVGNVAVQAANVDVINVEACRTRRATRCVNMSAQAKTGGFSTKPPVIDNWFSGWFLFAFDHRIAAPDLIAEPGYDSPAVIPPVKLGQTVARSTTLGPIRGPRPPKVTVLSRSVLHGGRVLVARVRCAVSCTVWLWVDDHRRLVAVLSG